MPIPLPNLDDRTYADLTAEAQALIPSVYPTWTNHNPSDPGIVVMELLAWLTETVLYQLNEIPEQNVETFLRLLGGARQPHEPLDSAIQRTILDLRTLYRAVTAADFETLARTQWLESAQALALAAQGQTTELARVQAVPRRNLAAEERAGRSAAAAGHLSVVVIPATAEPFPQPGPELRRGLWEFLDGRRLLTVRHHVVGPTYVPVQLGLTIYLRSDALPGETLRQVYTALAHFFDPIRGGPEGTGWPFGRDVYISEIYAELEKLVLVDFVDDVRVTAADGAARLIRDEAEIIGVALDAHELVEIRVTELFACGRWRRSRSGCGGHVGTVATGISEVILNEQAVGSMYLHYLPAIFRQDAFAGRFLLAMEAILSGLDAERAAEFGLEPVVGLEAKIAQVHRLFDPQTTDAEFLPWLASWVAIALRADWDEATQRAFIQKIVPLYKLRGTKAGLEAMLTIYTREPVTIYDDFDEPAHYFQVKMTLSDRNKDSLRRKQQIARAIIDQEKPAHTFYALQIAVPTMRLPAHLGTEETLLGTEIPSA
ncbi:MAG: phage tail protein [Caldilineaceae bacterium]